MFKSKIDSTFIFLFFFFLLASKSDFQNCPFKGIYAIKRVTKSIAWNDVSLLSLSKKNLNVSSKQTAQSVAKHPPLRTRLFSSCQWTCWRLTIIHPWRWQLLSRLRPNAILPSTTRNRRTTGAWRTKNCNPICRVSSGPERIRPRNSDGCRSTMATTTTMCRCAEPREKADGYWAPKRLPTSSANWTWLP